MLYTMLMEVLRLHLLHEQRQESKGRQFETEFYLKVALRFDPISTYPADILKNIFGRLYYNFSMFCGLAPGVVSVNDDQLVL